MDKKLKDKIEELGWFITKGGNEDWLLSKYSPAGEDFGIVVSQANFLEDVKSEAENFDVDDHVDALAEMRGTHGVPGSFKILVEDAEDIQTMLTELYNGIKDLEVFNNDARRESKESN